MLFVNINKSIRISSLNRLLPELKLDISIKLSDFLIMESLKWEMSYNLDDYQLVKIGSHKIKDELFKNSLIGGYFLIILTYIF